MSPLLFSLLLDRASAYLAEHAPSATRVRCPLLLTLATTTLLLLADDVMLLGGSPARLQSLFMAFGSFSSSHFMSVGEAKSKVIEWGCSGLYKC